MREFDAQVAVNGDGFTPWHSNNLLDYSPHPGDPVTPNGTAASQGAVYATGNESTLYLYAENAVSFSAPESGLYNAISSDRMLLENGAPAGGPDDGTVAPRTAIGLDGSGQKLIIPGHERAVGNHLGIFVP